VLPIAKKCGWPITMNRRILLGLYMGIATSIVSGVLEIFRRQAPVMEPEVISHCGNLQPLSDFSMFWWMIPFAITAAGEILINPGMYHYVFTKTPARLSSVGQAFSLVVQGGVAGFMYNAIQNAMVKFVPANYNDGHVEYVYFVMVGFTILATIVFWFWLKEDEEDAPADDEKKAAELKAAELEDAM